jgi:D-alanine-D-alanine ligase
MGLPTPASALLTAATSTEALVAELGLPLMIKPAHEGSSIGMSKVVSVEQLEEAYREAARYDDRVLAEQFVTGAEYTVSIVNDQALPVIGLKTTHDFYDFSAKYTATDTRYLLPSGLSAAEEIALQQLALDAYRAVGCESWGRVDVMVDQQGQPWLLEVNTSPGMTDHSLVPQAAAHAGISFEQLVLKILATARLKVFRG